MYNIIWLIVAYFLGSIPFSLIIGKKFSSVDIRNHGSGNLGGTNAIRVLGKKHGLIAAALDVLKGFILVFLADKGIINFDYAPLYLGVAAAIGHCYPIFANFKGGKAVATSAGAILGVEPVIFLIGFVFILIVIKLSKYVSLGSILTGFVVIGIALLMNRGADFIIPSSILTVLIVFRHHSNIKRLIAGTENKANL